MQESESKAEFFARLYALKDEGSSDEEEDTNEAKNIWRRGRIPRPVQSVATPSAHIPPSRRHQARRPTKKIPAIQRTLSAPTPSNSIVKETPVQQKNSLLRYDISTSPVTDASSAFVRKTPSENPKPSQSSSLDHRPEIQQRTVSDPLRGTLVLKNSTGIKTMLGKNNKRKRSGDNIKLVREGLRVFQGKTFFFIPNDDVATARRSRIKKAREYGATWTREFGVDVTHVIVDNRFTYHDALLYMKSAFSVDGFPECMVVVNEKYPASCIEFNSMVPPERNQFKVEGVNNARLRARTAFREAKKHPAEEQIKGNDEQGKKTPPRDEPTQEEFIPLPKFVGQTTGMVESLTEELSPQKYAGFGAEMEEIIKLARNTHLVQLDEEHSDTQESLTNPNSPEGSDDSEREVSPTKVVPNKKRRTGSKGCFNQDNFSCMKGGKGEASGKNPNEDIIQQFLQLAGFYERIRDQWRNLSYRRGVTALRQQTKRIKDYDEAIQIPQIGDSLATKIVEFHRRGHLAKLKYANLDGRDSIVQVFIKIYGVGPSQAEKWIDQGHKTIEDLVANVPLTENQKIGIAHYEDFNTRIPREEMYKLGAIVKKAVAEIDPDVEATIGGSYRRGAKASGDIDFMLTKPGTTTTAQLLPFLEELVKHLTNSHFLVAALSVPSKFQRHSDSGSKWHGVCVLPGNPIWRRIDLLLVPASEWGAALIYFTGDDIFNRSLRLLASKFHMRLNQRGLYKDCMRDQRRVKLTEGTLIPGLSERDIFEKLGVPWRPPEERILN